ncbi:hypothetical protein [Actinomadura sp. 9N407]|uniref:hypothetical protein n=1 Tax=Actinomadura sp. 9N407 TaxID=3375154 RepID=UPI0037B8D08B
MYCSTCGDEREFERPPCQDGHGPDCPERACVECGSAVLTGLPAGVAWPDEPAATGSAPSPRAHPATSAPRATASKRAVA